MTIKNKFGIEFTFRDSVRLFPGKLEKLCEDLKPKFSKLTDHKFKFDDLNAVNIFEDELQTEIREYLKHDCLSLAEIMIKFRQQLIYDPKIEIDITNCYTSSTLAKKLFFEKYYYRYCHKETEKYIYEVNKEIDAELRMSYFGGRCDIYGYGKFNKCYYYDFTSLYPYVGSKYMFPIGDPELLTEYDLDECGDDFTEEFDIDNFFGFILCKVRTNPKTIPLHGFKY
jgi:hypothetical protein